MQPGYKQKYIWKTQKQCTFLPMGQQYVKYRMEIENSKSKHVLHEFPELRSNQIRI